ncbi:MAG: Carboxyl-terminal protease [Microgenomates group bacterium GW2011_GWC1_43_11]|uniref:Carboxyl-terminal protease n=1 Tax=Candidatus Gottesmanbacteria bacterium GW2011_GWB1_44_11c TaxID=1618447 RepID=A0A0G1GJ97_9BACT|nr:MAG: Carboxyl-terminal protease [Microgenomates group bacterium GW2011_GWC1_43_11]KKT34413.1 MAG: Carboxyl-terminal protease [Candidatus Gottesmanbacteria bacterium GW2011_GWB1_44_11c]HCM81991.1 S41 family peptidase [Patescibacteria group bacterium]
MSLPSFSFRKILLSLAILFLVGTIGYKLGERKALQVVPILLKPIRNREQPANQTFVDFSLFWDVWGRLQRFYIDAANIDTQKMIWGAISGAVNSLDDPYTVFLPPKENKEFKEDLGGTFEGIGAQLDMKEGRLIIVAPLKGTPAQRAGLKPFDWILKVDGEDTINWTLAQAVAKIRGPKGSSVKLTILHEKAEKPEEVTIVRDGILVPSVEYWMKSINTISEISGTTSSARLRTEEIAYLKLSRFGDRTNEEWLKAVADIAKSWKIKDVKGLVLDLRNNPGGYLDGSVFITSEFLKNGLIVTQTNSDGTQQDYSVDRKGQLFDIPLVVLINKGSASASEIVAGAIRDYNRGTIVGETSFGKGSVQTPQELEGGASVHITTGKWLLPKGDWIHKKGITPSVEVTMNGGTEATSDAQLIRAIEVLLQ